MTCAISAICIYPKLKGKLTEIVFCTNVFLNITTYLRVLNQSKTYQYLSDCVKKNYLVNSCIESIKVSVITLKNNSALHVFTRS